MSVGFGQILLRVDGRLRDVTSGSVDVWVKRRLSAGCESCQGSWVGDAEDRLDVEVTLEIGAVFELGFVVWGLLIGAAVDDDELEFVCACNGVGAV